MMKLYICKVCNIDERFKKKTERKPQECMYM